MFWRFNYLTSDIDNLLDKEDVTLLEILNEDDVLQECKAQNKKLVDFLVRPENLEQLVDFVIKSPADDVDEKMKYKYPNIACELLTSDVNQITESLVASGPLLDSVMNFLQPDERLNPLQASFFGKVLGLLITRKGELVVEFLKSHEQFLSRVLHHLGTSAIMDLLLRLVTSLEPMDSRAACIAWIQQQELIKKLIAMIDPHHSAERNCNAAQALCDLICITREQLTQMSDSTSVPDPLLTEIEAEETVTLLLNHMFDGGEITESVITSGLQVIQTLLEYRRVGPEGNLEQMIDADRERFSSGITNTINAVIPRLKDLHNILLNPPQQHYQPMVWTLGVLSKPLGNTRLQIVRLIATLLASNMASVSQELARLGTINVLLDLYFEYSWNNFLHRQVELCLSTILLNDSSDTTLLTQLISEFRLIEKVVKGFHDNDQLQASAGGHRQGYMGHLTRVANSLVNNTGNNKNSQTINDLILGLPVEVRDSWELFKTGSLADTNKRNTCDLVPCGLSSNSDLDEFGRIIFPQDTGGQKVGRTARLFGFNEDDLVGADDDNSLPFGEQRLSLSPSSANNDSASAAMFEDKCSQQNNDISDEDMWEEKEITFSPTASQASHPTAAAESTSVVRPHRMDRDSDDDEDDDARQHRHSSSDSDEEREIPESLRRIVQQPDVSTAAVKATVAATEDMDITSTDDWANFDDIAMEAAPAVPADPLPWDTSSPDKAFAVDTSSSSANDSWATFAGDSSTTAVGNSSGANDDSNWADFTGFSCSGLQNSSGFEFGSATEPDIISSSRTAAYLVSSSSDVDNTGLSDNCHSSVGSSNPFSAHFTNTAVISSGGLTDQSRTSSDTLASSSSQSAAAAADVAPL